MGSIVLAAVVLAFSVCLYESLNTGPDAIPTVYNFEELVEHEKLYSKLKLLADGKQQQLPAFEQMCYNANNICNSLVEVGQEICGYHDKYGLVNFPNICELRFHNCLIKSYEERTGNTSKTGPFYYNAEDKGCQYYLEKTSSIEAAIEYYIMDDMELLIKQHEIKDK